MATRRTLVLLLGLALLGVWATPTHAQERVTLQYVPGGLSSPDSQLRSINTWLDEANPSTDHHATDGDLQVQSGDTGNANAAHALFLFDLSRIPRSGIKSASLNLWLDTAPTTTRNWEVHQVTSFIGVPLAYAISWTHRTNQLHWTALGGDFGGAPIATFSPGTTNGVRLTLDVSSAAETWFGGAPLTPNYGLIIKDVNEDTDPPGSSNGGLLASNFNGTAAHAPALVVTFIQEVRNLTATPGNGSVTLSWTYPPQVANSTILNATSGVVIVRNDGAPVPDDALIQDGTMLPALCSPVGASGAFVVYTNSTGSTTFTDTTVTGCPLVDDLTSFYKVIAAAQIGSTGAYNYSTNVDTTACSPFPTTCPAPPDNAFVSEIAATPSATAPQAPHWIAPVRGAALAAPSIDPGNYAIVAANNSVVQGFNPSDGSDAIAPASIGGNTDSRMPVLEGTEADYGPSTFIGPVPMTFVAGDDSLVYDISLENSGFIRDFLNPVNDGATPGAYTGGVAMQVKAFSNSGNTKPNDVMIMGTRVVATPTANTIFAAVTCNLSVAPGTGCNGSGGGWNITGGTGGVTSTGCSTTSTAATCNIDIITSTPFVDYFRNTVWVTSHNGNTSGQVASPDVWKLDANSGAVLAAVNVGGNIDASPTETLDQSVIFVGTNGGVLLAYDPANVSSTFPTTPNQLGTLTISPNDGAIKGFPLVANSASPWTVVVSTNTKVQAVSFDTSTNIFSTLWTNSTLGCNPSSPITSRNTTDALNHPVVFVGCSDGRIHELLLSTGVDEAQRIVDPFGGVIVGDPSLDLNDNEIIVGASDGRVFAFSLPF